MEDVLISGFAHGGQREGPAPSSWLDGAASALFKAVANEGVSVG